MSRPIRYCAPVLSGLLVVGCPGSPPAARENDRPAAGNAESRALEAAPPEGGDGAAGAPAVELAAAELGRAVAGDLRVSEPAEVFAPHDTIHVSVSTRGTAVRSRVTARWLFEGASGAELIEETTQTIAPRGAAVTEFHIARPEGWPVGSYRVEVSIDGRPAAIRTFTVREPGA